jgi:hypothetical protein
MSKEKKVHARRSYGMQDPQGKRGGGKGGNRKGVWDD